MSSPSAAKRLTGSIIVIIILSVCLCISSYALVLSAVSVENNLFHTGNVHINLNDGKPVITEHEFLFEPGMTVKKDFFIENNSSASVYYRLYFDDARGGLKDILEITVKDGDKTLYSGTLSELSRAYVTAADDVLQIKEKKTLSVEFYFPKNVGNSAQKLDLSFTMCAEATQTKNNPNRIF